MKAMVIEDSRLARQGLIRMLSTNHAIDIVAEAEHPVQALPLIEQHRPELLFLDIHMPGESGFSLLAKLDYSPKIIFTTAYSEFAIQSFDHHTVDYLLKPISQQRLDTALSKLLSSVNKNADKIETARKKILSLEDKLFLKEGEQCFLVALEEIAYFESCKNYVRTFFNGNKAFIKKSLSSVEQRLPNNAFFRVNRQYIVNLNHIKNIEETISGYLMTMSDGKLVDLSRRSAMALKEQMSL